jgi:hypothetical protein
MRKPADITGQRFGKLTAIKPTDKRERGGVVWECKCDCGNTTIVASRDLVNGHTQSCGCRQKETISKIRKKHGDRDARLYSVWKTMKKRCENQNANGYKYYGDMGVKVCEEWHDYSEFKAWALANGYDEKAKHGVCTIDRINPYGNYEPANCRWVSMAEQNRNKRADWRGTEDG